MEAKCFFETSIDFQQTTRRYIPEDRTVNNHRCEIISDPENHSLTAKPADGGQ
jgi:hypothetical protein